LNYHFGFSDFRPFLTGFSSFFGSLLGSGDGVLVGAVVGVVG
jgi:hypothetical protein